MPDIYKKCFIGLRLTINDGNANMVQELEAMSIPVIHNHSNYGIKWKGVDDIVDYINVAYQFFVKRNYGAFNKNPIDFSGVTEIEGKLGDIYKNIDYFTLFLKEYKNILFISSGYPGYGGAATNCDGLARFYAKDHNVKCIYWNYNVEEDREGVVREDKLREVLEGLNFRVDLVILKSCMNWDIREVFKCPIVFLVPGIFEDTLNMDYRFLGNKIDRFINRRVLRQVRDCDISFCNSDHSRIILQKMYGLKTNLFYSSFVEYYGKGIERRSGKRKYDYALIMSNFDRPIKNARKSTAYLSKLVDKKIILIGRNSDKYRDLGFDTVDLVNHDDMAGYYREIDCIVQDSHYESCSNVLVEALFNDCKISRI